MSANNNTLLLQRACQLRWPTRPIAGLAKLLTRPKSTAAAWLSGRRHMQPRTMHLLSEILRDQGQFLVDISAELAKAAELARAQPRRPRGFEVVKDWDGIGFMYDRRWRGGKSRKHPS